MLNEFSRTELLIGQEKMNKLKKSKVAIFGLGGVGSYVLEGLARAGIGSFILVDNDDVSKTNINRQILATNETIGKRKVELAKERLLKINKDAKIEIYDEFFTPDSKDIFDATCDYVIDAIDTVAAKLELVERANKYGVKIISCMGTGNKLNPTMIEVTDISKTSVCPLAKVMRKELSKRGIKHLKVVYSKEQPIKADEELLIETMKEEKISKRQIPGSVSFVPSVAGLVIASEVVKDLCEIGMK